jgi:hypothetical protein
MLASVIDLGEFSALCSDVRAQAEAMLRADPSFRALVNSAADTAESVLHEQNDRLERRKSAQLGELAYIDETLAWQILINKALLACILQPRLHLDSVGFIILSNDAPPAGVLEGAL